MKFFGRYVDIRIISAEPESLVSDLLAADIDLWNVQIENLLTIVLTIRYRQLPLLKKILEKSGSTCQILKKEGLYWSFNRVRNRSAFLVGILTFVLCAIWIPGRVFFLETSGNERIPSKRILSEVESYGIRFGSKASDVRSEELKNKLLSSIPQLQWVGVDIQGTKAIIQVKERSVQENMDDTRRTVSSIVANKDGVITKMTVESGTPLFSVGQSVKENEVIVSGYTDCGIKVIAGNAKAEVFAHTLHEKEFVSPLFSERSGVAVHKTSCYKLRIGKKVINLCNHSGISDATCVKMYSENYWTLPGGFRLPVSVIKIDYMVHDGVNQTKEAVCDWLMAYARSYIRQQMIAGEILSEDTHLEMNDGIHVLTGYYSCNELIGQVKYEEIMG